MKKQKNKSIYTAIGFLAAFLLWTMAVRRIDVQPIGPGGSSVGFAALNESIHRLTGVHMTLYTLTDWLGLVPLGFVVGFAVLGLMQWIDRKKFLRVDFSLLMLGAFYLTVLAAYAFFETVVVNYRPVLIAGVLEASYPSSTTMLVMCVMPTAIMQLNARIRNGMRRRCAVALIAAFTVFMVMGRLISGVHWFSDIVGGGLLSAGLVKLYAAVIREK